MEQGVSEVDEGVFSVDKGAYDARRAPLKQMSATLTERRAPLKWRRAPLTRKRTPLTRSVSSASPLSFRNWTRLQTSLRIVSITHCLEAYRHIFHSNNLNEIIIINTYVPCFEIISE